MSDPIAEGYVELVAIGYRAGIEAAAQFVESHTFQEVKGLPHAFDPYRETPVRDFELMFGTSKEHDALAAAVRALTPPAR